MVTMIIEYIQCKTNIYFSRTSLIYLAMKLQHLGITFIYLMLTR